MPALLSNTTLRLLNLHSAAVQQKHFKGFEGPSSIIKQHIKRTHEMQLK